MEHHAGHPKHYQKVPHSLHSDPFAQKLVTWSHIASRDAGKCSLYSGWLQVHQKFGSFISKEEEVNEYWGTIAVSATKQEMGNERSLHTSIPSEGSWSVCGTKKGKKP